MTASESQSSLESQRVETESVAAAMNEMEASVTEVSTATRSSQSQLTEIEQSVVNGQRQTEANLNTQDQLSQALQSSTDAITRVNEAWRYSDRMPG